MPERKSGCNRLEKLAGGNTVGTYHHAIGFIIADLSHDN